MIRKQVVDFRGFVFVGEIDCAPFVTCRQTIWVFLNLFNCFDFDRCIKLVIMITFKVLGHWLVRPEVMLHEEGDELA
jgi:hypothetical protein